jgi:hypothetical protein
MKHLKTYKQIFESDTRNNRIVEHAKNVLREKISFPDLYKTDLTSWARVVEEAPWSYYLEHMNDMGEEPMDKSEYMKYVKEHKRIRKENPSQGKLDLFIGAVDYDEVEMDNHVMDYTNEPVEVIMDAFKQPKDIALMIKMIIDGSNDHFDPGFTAAE